MPFVAVAAANAINIPLMRQRELRTGVPIFDENDNRLGLSIVSRFSVDLSTSYAVFTP